MLYSTSLVEMFFSFFSFTEVFARSVPDAPCSPSSTKMLLEQRSTLNMGYELVSFVSFVSLGVKSLPCKYHTHRI